MVVSQTPERLPAGSGAGMAAIVEVEAKLCQGVGTLSPFIALTRRLYSVEEERFKVAWESFVVEAMIVAKLSGEAWTWKSVKEGLPAVPKEAVIDVTATARSRGAGNPALVRVAGRTSQGEYWPPVRLLTLKA